MPHWRLLRLKLRAAQACFAREAEKMPPLLRRAAAVENAVRREAVGGCRTSSPPCWSYRFGCRLFLLGLVSLLVAVNSDVSRAVGGGRSLAPTAFCCSPLWSRT